jgi:hypothetical protein
VPSVKAAFAVAAAQHIANVLENTKIAFFIFLIDFLIIGASEVAFPV